MNRTVVAANFALFLLLAAAAFAVPGGRFVLVVGPPGSSLSAVHSLIARAGGSFVEPTRYPFMAVAYSEGDDFVRRLFGEGALLVLNHAFAAGCLREETP